MTATHSTEANYEALMVVQEGLQNRMDNGDDCATETPEGIAGEVETFVNILEQSK